MPDDATARDTLADETLARLKRVDALLEGHFQLSSGRHSDRYVQCARLLMHPVEAEPACKALADKLRPHGIDLVVGPAMGGIVVAYEVGRQLGVPAVFTERQDGEMTLRRGFSLEPGTRVAVIEDVVTTGGSALEVFALLKSLGADVVAAASLVQRAASSPFDVPYETLLPLTVQSWAADECPLCKAGGKAVKPGSRPGA